MTKTDIFRDSLGRNTFKRKYALNEDDTWGQLAHRLVDDVCGTMGGTRQRILSKEECDILEHEVIGPMKFIPGGRYLYYAGRPAHFWNNCFIFKGQADTREEWARICHDAMSALSCGGGIGVDYSIFRPAGRLLSRTGGTASGPIPLALAVNEIGRQVMQGGSRRSALYGSLDREHEDVWAWLHAKDWKSMKVPGTEKTVWDLKAADFNYPAPFDMTNISVNYSDEWLGLPNRHEDPIFLDNVRQALTSAEPGFSFNFGPQRYHTGRNAPVAASTRVLTDSGYVYVGDVVGQEVRVWTGKRWAKTIFRRTAESVPTISVMLSNGRTVTCDPEHPFIEWAKGKTVRTPAAQLELGASIECVLPQDTPATAGLEVERDYAFGFVWGDGHIRDGKGDLRVFSDTKKDCFRRACVALSGNAPEGDRLYFSSEYARKPFINSPAFLAGWFDADGCYARGLLRLSSTDRPALMTAQEMLDRVGVKSIVREDGRTGFGTDRPMFTLLIVKDSHNRFREVIPTTRVVPEPVIAVRRQNIHVVDVRESGRVEDVFCCDVGVEEHSFLAEGVLLSNCTEFISDDDSDVCNLGSINLSRISSLEELYRICRIAAKFLICGSMRADLPHDRIKTVRDRNRRIGMGLMGVGEWFLQRGLEYGPDPVLGEWLKVWASATKEGANEHCDRFYLNRPKAYMAVAPAGTIAMLAGTSSGIEPVYACAYKRRYLVGGTTWKYQLTVDATAQQMLDQGVDRDLLERSTALALAATPRKRLELQALVQDHTDMGISSTVNLPAWGTELNNEDRVSNFAQLISEFAPRLRGLTFYPDGCRGGQPLTQVPLSEAEGKEGIVYEENTSCAGGVCGV